MDIRALILLVIAISVPLVLLITGRRQALVVWVGITLFVHIFDTAIITNLPAGRIVGLVYLPYAMLSIHIWSRSTPAKVWLINLVYLIMLGIVFGYIWPWPDITKQRPFTMTAPGRTIVYLIRLISDLSLIVFMARELQKPERINVLARAMVIGSSLTALAGIFYFITLIDPYFTVTGLRDLGGNQRARGLSFEPRGLGMACVYGLMILILTPGRLSFKRIGLIVLNLLGFVASYSTSSLALLVAGLVASWILLSRRIRFNILALLGIFGILTSLAPILVPRQFQVAVQSVQERIDPTVKLRGAVAENVGQAVAYRLDSFDASALLFLMANPEYAIIGTGPGMMLLPASEYVPPGIYSIMYPREKGLDGLPTHGLLLEVSNSGIVGLGLWIVQVISCYAALKMLSRNRADLHLKQVQSWQLGKAIFLIGTVFYIVQVSMTSPIWSVILGIGWAATAVISRRHIQEAASTPPRIVRGIAEAGPAPLV